MGMAMYSGRLQRGFSGIGMISISLLGDAHLLNESRWLGEACILAQSPALRENKIASVRSRYSGRRSFVEPSAWGLA